MDYRIYNHDQSGPWLVLLHGLGANSKIWYKQLKEFRKHFTVLAIDLPGHSANGQIKKEEEFSFAICAQKVLNLLDELKITKAHFAGISLGTIIIHELVKAAPERMLSIVCGGAVTRVQAWAKAVLGAAYKVKAVLPYMLLYKIAASVIMPRKNHADARKLFIKEAAKMGRDQFLRWFYLLYKTKQYYHRDEFGVPKLYISGQEDHLFLPLVKKDVEWDNKATLKIIEKCGHVCNIDQPKEFNESVLHFLLKHARIKQVG
ncbi:alpha/beta fold hydrolase [Metabacillus iocasae]|uniref:Pimeloyl-ACP methyl ester carboxylesterase n=1 Tax=Priestia iocasae TaxID=2291674 RepID=A0ABS2QSL3_9BACI|nr:alpha/beta hydrolase [Metabacillus iocasae]MBM7702422.1 pimeloyl-ACP methyl ester carboxylesterase [Metabacillus iocasae]